MYTATRARDRFRNGIDMLPFCYFTRSFTVCQLSGPYLHQQQGKHPSISINSTYLLLVCVRCMYTVARSMELAFGLIPRVPRHRSRVCTRSIYHTFMTIWSCCDRCWPSATTSILNGVVTLNRYRLSLALDLHCGICLVSFSTHPLPADC